MLREKATQKQEGYEIVLLEELVPRNHLLRRIAATVDFGFIHDMCKGLYCPDNGRPAVEPEVLFKMLFIGYLFGIKSETRLVEEIECNVAYRWFLGLGLRDRVPNHATISINRARRFRDNNIAEKIFDEILQQANKQGWQAVLGKKPFDKDDDQQPPITTQMQSTTDPDSGQLNKEGKPDGFHYSEHRTVDGKNNIIVNSYVTAANIHDVTPLPQILEQIERRLDPFFPGRP